MSNSIVGKCGMPCELCPMFHINTEKRCTGCSKERKCSIVNCCDKRQIIGCFKCEESPCKKITKMKEFPGLNLDRIWEKNLEQIKESGFETWDKEYRERVEMIEIALQEFNAGRSKNLICKVFILKKLEVLQSIMEEAQKITETDKRERAKIFKRMLEDKERE